LSFAATGVVLGYALLERSHCHTSVCLLGSFCLSFHFDACRYMPEDDCSFPFVAILAAGAGALGDALEDLIIWDSLFGLALWFEMPLKDGDCHGAGMDPAASLCRRNPLPAVAARLLEERF
jgi:hypothetical protein